MTKIIKEENVFLKMSLDNVLKSKSNYEKYHGARLH